MIYTLHLLPRVQIWNANFFLKKTRENRKNNKKCFIQSILHRLLCIFRTFVNLYFEFAICEYHASKNLLLSLRTIPRAIFSHLRTNQSAAQQVCDPSMQISGNRKESNLVSKPHGAELPSWVLRTCREPVFPYVMEHCQEEKWFCVASFDILTILIFLSSRKRF